MTREQYESLPLSELKAIAKARGLKRVSTLRKGSLIDRMLEEDAAEAAKGAAPEAAPEAEPKAEASDKEKAERPKHSAKDAREYAKSDDKKKSVHKDAPERPSGVKQSNGLPVIVIRTRATNEPAAPKPEQDAVDEKSESTDRIKNVKTAHRTTETKRVQSHRQNESDHASSSRVNEPSGTQTYRTNNAGQTRRTGGTYRTAGGYRQNGQTKAAEPHHTSYRTSRQQDAEYRADEQQSAGQDNRAYSPSARPQNEDGAGGGAATDAIRHRKTPAYSEQARTQSSPDEENRSQSQEAENFRGRTDVQELDSGKEAHGILEVLPEGYGFIRSDNFLPGEDDVYVSPSQIRKFGLKTGDMLTGNTRVKSTNEKFSALLYINSVNGMHPFAIQHRPQFENMTPIFPNERIHLERPAGSVAMRIVDLISPIGKGQRGMIVSPPKAGKTTLLKDTAKSILKNNPEMHLIILLIDERPEEVTDIKETVKGDNVEVIYSTFDELPDHHRRVSEMVIERAKRLVENRKDVMIFIDSITRLARAYNQVVPPSGRTLSGGLDPAALHMPKRFFGAARNMREGGSLTILATALVDTGSKMDDVVYEEFKGTGNMELVLDRKLQERRIFPAIDIIKSGTRKEDLLLSRDELETVTIMRRALNRLKAEESAETILNLFLHTRSNEELVRMINRRKTI